MELNICDSNKSYYFRYSDNKMYSIKTYTVRPVSRTLSINVVKQIDTKSSIIEQMSSIYLDNCNVNNCRFVRFQLFPLMINNVEQVSFNESLLLDIVPKIIMIKSYITTKAVVFNMKNKYYSVVCNKLLGKYPSIQSIYFFDMKYLRVSLNYISCNLGDSEIETVWDILNQMKLELTLRG